MSGRTPDEIFEEGLDEGERRLERGALAMAATGFAGGIDVFFGIVAVVVTTGAIEAVAAGALADTQGQRAALPALPSAIAAGTVMTLYTWVVAAAEDATSRLLASLLVGFILMAPSLNHAVVGFGEIAFGLIAGTTKVGIGDLLGNTSIAVVGNLIGGVGLVFATASRRCAESPTARVASGAVEIGGIGGHARRARA